MTALPDPFRTSAVLRRAAGLSRQELEGLQLRKIQSLTSRLHATSPYYRRRMEEAKLEPEEITSLEVFRMRFPCATKADFLADQSSQPPFGGRLSIPRDEVALVTATSGTSGQGQEIYGRSQRDVHLLGHLHAMPWFMAGLREGDVVINCVPSGGLTTGGWGPPEGFRIAGATVFHLGGTHSTEAKIELMLSLGRVDFLYASTNYLHTLTQGLLARGITPRETLPAMHGLFIAGEGYPLEWAETMERLWGCRLQEGYGSTQCHGFAGTTAPSGVFGANGGRGRIRLFEWEVLVEILDPRTGAPVEPGARGEMVITNLSVEGSPAVRFRTGDAVRFVPWQEAGGGLCWNAIESGTIGRFDDMMKIRGNNLWPQAVDAVVFAHGEIRDYRGRVFTRDGKTAVEICVAFADHASGVAAPRRADLLESVRQAIKERTNVLMEVREVPRSALPEFALKARRWTDERQQGYRI